MVDLIVVIMGPGNENFLQMAKDSVKDADKVLHFTSDMSLTQDKNTFYNNWNKSNKKINGIARNVYLKYLKDKYPDDWALCIDEDEVVEDLNKIKEGLQ